MSLAALAPYALSAIVLVTTLGALVTALVMFRWGASGNDDLHGDELDGDVDDASREFVSMVRRDRTARRARALRAGHVVAIACFAIAATLAVVALNRAPQREPSRSGPVEARAADAPTATQLEERVRTLEERLVAAESRAAEARLATQSAPGGPPSSGGPATPPSQPSGEGPSPTGPPPAASQPPKPAPGPPAVPSQPQAQPGTRASEPDGRKAARAEPQPPRASPELPPARDSQKATPGRPSGLSSALPRGVAGPTATVGNVRIEVLSQPERSSGGAPASYAVRLTDLRGTPLTDAEVSVLARMGDGTSSYGVLAATDVSGTYAGDVILGQAGPWDLRLRIARRQTTFELPLASPASW
jgi:hypothetical protein